MNVASQMVLRMAAWLGRVLPDRVKLSLYRLGGVTSMLRALLNRAAPPEPQVVEIAGGRLQGYRFELDLQREKDLWLGSYELELQLAISQLLETGQVAFDVGANLGYMTLLMAEAVGPSGSVIAFEPLPHNVRRIQTNLALNPPVGPVSLLPVAVGAQSGRARFLVHPSPAMGKLQGSSGRAAGYEGELEVEMVALDDFVRERGNRSPDLIKIDVEGGEAQVLAGAQGLLKSSRPTVLLEIHGGQAARACLETFRASGYRVVRLADNQLVERASDLPWKSLVRAEWAPSA